LTVKGLPLLDVARSLVEGFSPRPLAALVTGLWEGGSPELLTIVPPGRGRPVSRERRRLGSDEVLVTKVSQNLFDKDVLEGFLGEFVACFLLEPYTPLSGTDYLLRRDIDFKVRIVREEFENLNLRFHDLLPELLLDPCFFFHSKMQRRSRIYPPSRSRYIRVLEQMKGDACGFEKALRNMVSSGLITWNGYVRATEKLLSQLPQNLTKNITPFREVELAIRRLAAYGIAHNFPGPSFINEVSRELDLLPASELQELPDPMSFLFLPTDGGLVTVDDRRGLRDLIPAQGSGSREPESIRRIGGALNFVYLVRYADDGEMKQVVAKTYQNWYGLKWIPLSIWAIGSQNFNVLGESRLVNEYRMNRFLRSKGLNTPEIYHVSVPRRTIVEEFISGTGFDQIARECLSNPRPDLLGRIADLGEEISRIHLGGAALGDSKPDNAILDGEGRIWFVDLEQAAQGGDPTWDVAEFLYYSGHYTLRWRRMKPLAKSFVEGYLRSGDSSIVAQISKAKYKRVFGIITAPHIIMGISRLCSSYASGS